MILIMKALISKIFKETLGKRNEFRKATLQKPSIDAPDKYKEQRKTINKILRREEGQFTKEND